MGSFYGFIAIPLLSWAAWSPDEHHVRCLAMSWSLQLLNELLCSTSLQLQLHDPVTVHFLQEYVLPVTRNAFAALNGLAHLPSLHATSGRGCCGGVTAAD